MVDETRKPVLQDHIAVKRKLVPPLVHGLGGKLSQYSWTRQLVPEALWIGLIVDHCGYHAARGHCRTLVQVTCAAIGAVEHPPIIKFSAFAELSDTAKKTVSSTIGRDDLEVIRQSLAPLAAITSDHPLAFLGNVEPLPEQNTRFPELLREFYDRNSRAAVLSIALGYELGIDQGKVHVSGHLIEGLIARFKIIDQYPETEEARQAAGYFRASAAMLFMSMNVDEKSFDDDASWVAEFWDSIAGFGPCLLTDTLKDETLDSEDPFEQFVFNYRNAVRADLRARLEKWPLNLNEIEVFEVVTALLCRQANLALDMASAPGVWTPHTAPVLLRAMADVFINLAWILKDPPRRARLFVEDGLGAIKLQIAHHKRALEVTTDPEDLAQLQQMIDVWNGWLAGQRIEAFVEVNLGSWSGTNTRKMAEEAGFIDFYNYVYQPFSSTVHSNWAHVSMFNTLHCQNPAHRWHRGAAIGQASVDPNWLYLASKYLSKTFGHFDLVHKLDLPHAAFNLIAETLPEMTEEAESE